MDDKTVVLDILSRYDEIKVLSDEDNIIFFQLKEKEYCISYPKRDDRASNPQILVKNYDDNYYPHIMMEQIPIENRTEKYHSICLNEAGSSIQYITSFEDKIIDILDRLIHLLSLSQLEIENEFQKEFLFYWNMMAEYTLSVKIFIGRDRVYKKMNIYHGIKGEMRVVSKDIKLNDKDIKNGDKKVWNHIADLPIYYIPIIDNRRILPPSKSNKWTTDNILQIIEGQDFARISRETYEKIKQEKIALKRIGLVFEMIVNGNSINFCCFINFKNAENNSLLNKLKGDITSIDYVICKRIDFYHLCKQIGNDTTIIDKKILLVGAGSLGSYVGKELIKSGIKNLIIYDGDYIEYENMLRHSSIHFGEKVAKVLVMELELKNMHPEIQIETFACNINETILQEKMWQFDIIIFTVGNSDVQLMANKLFKKNNYNKPVIFAWLEAGGIHSHILTVDYSKEGCFECLYTDQSGNYFNNKVNIYGDEEVEMNTLRNGCGATRVAYGTEILLRTTSVLLNTVKSVFHSELDINNLININPMSVSNEGNTFKERECQCCGNKDI